MSLLTLFKCSGGWPCDHCERTHQPCVLPSRQPKSLLFIEQNPVRAPSIDADCNLAYFFSSFLPMNLLSNDAKLRQSELQLMLHESQMLGSAVAAVATLHRSRWSRNSLSSEATKKDECQALRSYNEAAQCIRSVIASKIPIEASTLWSTFFLALFEVCVTPTLVDFN